jgi:hypothetical protein
MAGRGPAPKDPQRRARRNADVIALRVLPAVTAEQPDLPEFEYSTEVEGVEVSRPFVWPAATRAWWSMLEWHPLKGEFTEMDWSYLLDTALLHADYWSGQLKHAPELRLREAKYGFTPEDRARLRIQFAQATEAEIDTARKVTSSVDRFADLTVESMDPDVAP